MPKPNYDRLSRLLVGCSPKTKRHLLKDEAKRCGIKRKRGQYGKTRKRIIQALQLSLVD